jgi:hypothetical protein
MTPLGGYRATADGLQTPFSHTSSAPQAIQQSLQLTGSVNVSMQKSKMPQLVRPCAAQFRPLVGGPAISTWAAPARSFRDRDSSSLARPRPAFPTRRGGCGDVPRRPPSDQTWTRSCGSSLTSALKYPRCASPSLGLILPGDDAAVETQGPALDHSRTSGQRLRRTLRSHRRSPRSSRPGSRRRNWGHCSGRRSSRHHSRSAHLGRQRRCKSRLDSTLRGRTSCRTRRSWQHRRRGRCRTRRNQSGPWRRSCFRCRHHPGKTRMRR